MLDNPATKSIHDSFSQNEKYLQFTLLRFYPFFPSAQQAAIRKMGSLQEQPVYNSIPIWLENSKSDFKPPVCNKLMHGPDGQLFVMYVGGPNQRKDFHLEEGEELFYMERGDMNLIVQEKQSFRNITIREGEIFLLPGRIPHSPQRFADTVGLVIERQRTADERDCIRYFVKDSTHTLFERWMYCTNLGTQIAPIIKEFFASSEFRTGKTSGDSVKEPAAFEPDSQRSLGSPFTLKNWIKDHEKEIEGAKNGVRLFDLSYQTDVVVYGGNNFSELERNNDAERWVWQLTGTANVELRGDDGTNGVERHFLEPQTSLLVRKGQTVSLENMADGMEKSFTIVVTMDPKNKSRAMEIR